MADWNTDLGKAIWNAPDTWDRDSLDETPPRRPGRIAGFFLHVTGTEKTNSIRFRLNLGIVSVKYCMMYRYKQLR